jgi:hypothetical protein
VSRFGNPFKVEDLGQEGAYRLHRETLLGDQAEAWRLLGYDCAIDLGCYCAPACHATLTH